MVSREPWKADPGSQGDRIQYSIGYCGETCWGTGMEAEGLGRWKRMRGGQLERTGGTYQGAWSKAGQLLGGM